MEDVTYSMLKLLFKNISKHILQCKTNDHNAFTPSMAEWAKKDMDIQSLAKASTLYYSLSGKASLNTYELSTKPSIGNEKEFILSFQYNNKIQCPTIMTNKSCFSVLF